MTLDILWVFNVVPVPHGTTLGRLYKTLLVFDNYELLEELQNVRVWGACSEFEITTVLRDGYSAYQELKRNHYDLVIAEIRMTGLDGLQLLRQVKQERLCSHVVLCSEFSDFDYARQGIILGAFDYLVKPFQPDLILTMFSRIKNETYKKRTTEIFVESITGANGVIIPPDGYLQGLRALCDKYHILLVCDEVMAGFGRTGKMFSFEHWGIKPDIITFAKGVTCGYVQLGGILISKEIADFFADKTFQYGLTYSGHSLACAAGVRHIGLFGAVELVKDKATKEPIVPYGRDPEKIMPQIHGLLKERGFSAFGRENNINVTPPLIITEEELREAIGILDEVLSIVDEKFV